MTYRTTPLHGRNGIDKAAPIDPDDDGAMVGELLNLQAQTQRPLAAIGWLVFLILVCLSPAIVWAGWMWLL